MKVLLINPSSKGTLRSLGFILPPLGILYVAASTRVHKHEVRVIDNCVDFRHVDFSYFDVVGIHSDTSCFNRALGLAREAKASGARVVMGGPHPCFEPDEAFQSHAVDAIVKGEGEEVFPELLDAWTNGGDPSSVTGLILPSNNGPIDTGTREHIRDLDSLPFPARDLLDMSLYKKTRMGGDTITSLHTSRGCPNRCKFCSSSRFDGTVWRHRSAESVLAEISYLVYDFGFRAFAFMDDNFTFSPSRVHAVCEGIIKRGLKIKWWCFSRVDDVTRYPDMVEHMADAGACSIFIGIETPSLAILERYGKGIAPSQALEAVNILRKNRFEILGSYILGAPEERVRDIKNTIRFARKLDTDTAQFTILTPYPGTDLYAELKDRIREKDWSKFDSMHAVFKHPYISRVHRQVWLAYAYILYYFRHTRSITSFFGFLLNRDYRNYVTKLATSFLVLMKYALPWLQQKR